MPAVDTENQFKFLLTCIKHSASGKINFDAVADEMTIVSKAAAAKRYERLLKAHNICIPPTPRKPKDNGSGSGSAGPSGTKSPRATPSKKRKAAQADLTDFESHEDLEEDEDDMDEDEDRQPVKREKKKVKREKKNSVLPGEDSEME